MTNSFIIFSASPFSFGYFILWMQPYYFWHFTTIIIIVIIKDFVYFILLLPFYI